MTHSRRSVAMLACCVAASAVLVGHASARQIFQERYEGEASFVYDNFCGVPNVSYQVVYGGKVKAVQRGANGFEYVHDHIKENEVYTNLANDKYITAVLKYNIKDPLKVTDNGDGTLTIVTMLTGSTMVYGTDGRAIGRTTGQSRLEILIDHGGTPTDPSDDVFISERRVKRVGRSDDLCAAAVEALT